MFVSFIPKFKQALVPLYALHLRAVAATHSYLESKVDALSMVYTSLTQVVLLTVIILLPLYL